MEQVVFDDLRVTSLQTQIILSFYSSTNIEKPDFVIDTQKLEGLESLTSPMYEMIVTFDSVSRRVAVREQIKGTARSKNGASGSLMLPLELLKDPSFGYKKKNDMKLQICLRLRKCPNLLQKHYSAEVQGSWKDGTRRMLQLYRHRSHANEIQLIGITIFKGPQTAHFMRTQVLSIFEPLIAPQEPLEEPPKEPRENPLEGQPKGPTERPPEGPPEMPDTETKESAATQAAVEGGTDQEAFSGWNVDTLAEATERIEQLRASNEALRLRLEEREGQQKAHQELHGAFEVENASLRQLNNLYQKRHHNSEAEIASLRQQLSGLVAPAQETVAIDSTVDLLGLDIEGDTLQDSVISPNLSFNNSDSHSGTTQSFHTPRPDSGDENEDLQQKLDTNVNWEEIREIDEAVEIVAHRQKTELRMGNAVTVEIKRPEEMQEWLEQRDHNIAVDTSRSRRTLAVLWLRD